MKLIQQSSQLFYQNKGNEKKNIKKQQNVDQLKLSITKDDQSVEQEYLWIYIKQLHFLQTSYWKDSNIYINIKTEDGEVKSKTKWKTDSPVFNHIVTIKMPKMEIKV